MWVRFVDICVNEVVSYKKSPKKGGCQVEAHLADYEKVYLLVTKYLITIICYEYII